MVLVMVLIISGPFVFRLSQFNLTHYTVVNSLREIVPQDHSLFLSSVSCSYRVVKDD